MRIVEKGKKPISNAIQKKKTGFKIINSVIRENDLISVF